MNFLEAITKIKENEGELVMQPCDWVLDAFVVDGRTILLVPGKHGGTAWMTTDITTLTGSWRVMTWNEFYAERDKYIALP